ARKHDEDVPRMRIRVKVSAVRYLLQVCMRKLVRKLGEVILDAANGWDVVDLDPSNALRGEHLVRRVGVDHARDQNVRELGESFSELGGVARLAAVIELVDQCALDLLHHANQIDAGSGG